MLFHLTSRVLIIKFIKKEEYDRFYGICKAIFRNDYPLVMEGKCKDLTMKMAKNPSF